MGGGNASPPPEAAYQPLSGAVYVPFRLASRRPSASRSIFAGVSEGIATPSQGVWLSLSSLPVLRWAGAGRPKQSTPRAPRCHAETRERPARVHLPPLCESLSPWPQLWPTPSPSAITLAHQRAPTGGRAGSYTCSYPLGFFR